MWQLIPLREIRRAERSRQGQQEILRTHLKIFLAQETRPEVMHELNAPVPLRHPKPPLV